MMSLMRNLTCRNESHQYFKILLQNELMHQEVMFPSSKHVQHRPNTSVAKKLMQQNVVADFSRNVVLHQDARDA